MVSVIKVSAITTPKRSQKEHLWQDRGTLCAYTPCVCVALQNIIQGQVPTFSCSGDPLDRSASYPYCCILKFVSLGRTADTLAVVFGSGFGFPGKCRYTYHDVLYSSPDSRISLHNTRNSRVVTTPCLAALLR